MASVIRAFQRVTLLVIVATRACLRPYPTATTIFHQSFVRCPTCTTATISFKNTTSCSTAELATVPRATLDKKHRMESMHGFANDASILTSMWTIRSNRVSARTKDTIVTVEIKPFYGMYLRIYFRRVYHYLWDLPVMTTTTAKTSFVRRTSTKECFTTIASRVKQTSAESFARLALWWKHTRGTLMTESVLPLS
ncbi:MAG: hypothetical protein BYD32DRAFT_252321 [Podila humilis]|nr:MAG: hypothetical protein BYD32DRAFT_252321 [Podila humilis]